MELWIRSQDRETLKQAYHLDIYSLLDSEIDNYWYIEESGTDLGVYNSKERALEVLDEIQNFIVGNIIKEEIVKHNLSMDNVWPIMTYEMPKE